MAKYLRLLNCSIKLHRCLKAMDIISLALTSVLSVFALIKAYGKLRGQN